MTSLSETAELRTSHAEHTECPSCYSTRLKRFYTLDGIPAHSCLLMDSQQEAIGYPTGRLDLEYCEDCGFIMNSSYDDRLKDYSPRYEETQHFSGCFNRFARRLAERWVDEYDLRGKTVLEIGCGKGEFLELLCVLGDNRGVGFDPGVNPQRLSKEANSRLRFVRDYYSERYRDEEADAICCRHTLEHIHDTGRFLSAIRRNIDDHKDALLLFELPDTTRVLRELAFWDLYYEHCSYFTAGSLARLFRRNHFDLLELQRDYQDQYLLIVARPTSVENSSSFDLEDDLANTAADIEHFQRHHRRSIAEWRQRLKQFADQGKRTAIWGGGSKAVSFLTTLGVRSEVEFVIDINPHKKGKFMPGTGHQVVGPETLREKRPDVVVLMNPIYESEVRQTLGSLSLNPQFLTV